MKSIDLANLILETKEVHNFDIRISADSEGNSFGTIEPDSFNWENNKLYIYPHVDHLEYDE